MERKWFYYRDGKGFGPYTADKILSWVRIGKLDASTLVWCDDLPQAQPLGGVEVFEGVQPSSEPPPLPSDEPPPLAEEKPPPLPADTSAPAPDGSVSKAIEPPPLPSGSDATTGAGNESPPIGAGAVQSAQDQTTANWMWSASTITLVVIFFSSIVALLSWDVGPEEDDSDRHEASGTVLQERWPSVFNPENRDQLADPQAPRLSRDLVEDVGEAFGFVHGQNQLLGRIQREFAGTRIAVEARLYQYRFRSSFGAAYSYIDSLFVQGAGERWTQAKRSIESQSASLFRGGTLSREEASEFVATVQDRSEGQLPSPILETLLMFTPRYIERPESMFDDGFIKEFRTRGHPKAKGVDLSIEYPASWRAEEGRRPNVVKKFTSMNGEGLVTAMILIREFPDDLPSRAAESVPEEAIWTLDADEVFGSVIPGAEVIETGKVRLARQPAIWGSYSATVDRMGLEIDLHGLIFMVARHDHIVQVTYTAGEKSESEFTHAQTLFEHYGALFQRMTNSVDFFGRYE